MRDLIRQMLRPLKTRIANSIARAVVRNVDDSAAIQSLQLEVLEGEAVDDCERLQEYGFTSVPLEGADVVVLFPNGDRGEPLVVSLGDGRYRPIGWAEGEVGLYNNVGAVVQLSEDGWVRLGSITAEDPIALKSDLQAIYDAISGAAVSPNDGGATFKANILAALAGFPVASTKVKAE